MANKPTVWLIDSSIYIYKAWFTWSEDYLDKDGNQVHAVLGFMNFVHQILNRNPVTHIAFAFDESQTDSFRREIYPAYKQNRSPTPASLKYQFELCRRFIRLLGVKEASSPRYEADDIIGSWTKQQVAQHKQVYIISADKDLTQLVSHDVLWWEYMSEYQLNIKSVYKRFKVRPDQIAAQLALAGDKVDNIPGVPEVGMSTAAKLLRKFDSIEGLLSSLDQVGNMQLKKAIYLQRVIEEHQHEIRLYEQLTRLHCDIPNLPNDLKRESNNVQEISELYNYLNVDKKLRTRWQIATNP